MTRVEDAPELSVVVAVVSGAGHLRGCLGALLSQQNPPRMEILVPHTGEDSELLALQSEFPDVQFPKVLHLRSRVGADGWSREHLDELRTKGIILAQGRTIAFVEDHGRADKNWARRMMDAYHAPCAAAGGAVENEVDRVLNWAVYFCDFGRYQNPVAEGPSTFLSDVNVSYKRAVLEKIHGVWLESFHETSVNRALTAAGETLWLSPEIVMYQHREGLSLSRALKERYVWGRSFGGIRSQEFKPAKRLVYLVLSPALPVILVLRKARDIVRKKRLLLKFLIALPLTVLLTLFWCTGEFAGYLTGSGNGEVKE